MKPLDEELSNKITYNPECQATFRKYKSTLRGEMMTALIPPIVIAIISFGIYLLMRQEHLSVYMLFFFPITVALALLFLTSLPDTLKDLNANKLNIEIDAFLRSYTIPDKNTKATYEGDFENAGRIRIPGTKVSSIQPNTKVYIIKTAHLNYVLDIVPVDKFENELLK